MRNEEPAFDHRINSQSSQEVLRTLEYYRALAHELIRGHEEERRRLGQELRDDLTQQLAALAIEAGRLEKDARELDVPLVGRISELKNSSVRLAEHAQLFCRQLYPAILEDLGLVEAIRSQSLAFQSEEGVLVTVQDRAVPPALPIDSAVCIFRLVQWALKNVAQHASATKVAICLSAKGKNLYLSIRDNGIGCDPRAIKKKKCLGFSTVRERVRIVNGSMKISAKPGSGLHMTARISIDSCPCR